LLPIPRKDADDLSLTAYIALDALRSGNGWIEGAQHLTETMLLSRFMAEAGQGAFEPEALVACDIALGKVFESGRLTGRWAVHAADYEWLAAVVSLYDWQLRTAPMGVLSAAAAREKARLMRPVETKKPGTKAGFFLHRLSVQL